MARRRKLTPSYLHHGKSNRARAVWTDSLGQRQYRLLPGEYDSAESRAAYARLLLELESTPIISSIQSEQVVSLAVILLAYLNHAQQHYARADGKHSSEFHETKLVIKTLREMYGETPAEEFGPQKLKATRQHWVNAGLARSECNRWTNIARRIFKWAAAEELIDVEVYQRLTVVTGLQKGRTAARETI